MRGARPAILVAAVLLGWGLPADADAAGQAGAAQRATETRGGETPPPRPEQFPEARLQEYIQARQQLEQRNPELQSALRGGNLEGDRAKLQTALSESSMSVEDFMQTHQYVQSHPELRSRVEAQLGTTGAAGTSGATGTSGAAGPGPAAPGSPGGAPAPGAQPGASPR